MDYGQGLLSALKKDDAIKMQELFYNHGDEIKLNRTLIILNRKSYTFLEFAILSEYYHTANFLLQKGAWLFISADSFFTPFELSVMQNWIGVFDVDSMEDRENNFAIIIYHDNAEFFQKYCEYFNYNLNDLPTNVKYLICFYKSSKITGFLETQGVYLSTPDVSQEMNFNDSVDSFEEAPYDFGSFEECPYNVMLWAQYNVMGSLEKIG